MIEPAKILKQGGAIVSREVDGKPILFLDVDGVIAPGNGNPIDRGVLAEVVTFVRLADARVVMCSDRVRSGDWYDEIVEAGMPSHRLRGQCDPLADASPLPSTAAYGPASSSKVRRVVEWLDLAQFHGVLPSRWCVLDDAKTFALDWRTCAAHVCPAGEMVTRVELALVWSLLVGKVDHGSRRRIKQGGSAGMLQRPGSWVIDD